MLRTEILETLGGWFERAEPTAQLMASLLPQARETWPFKWKAEVRAQAYQVQVLQQLRNDS